MNNFFQKIDHFSAILIIKAIRIYQHTLSFDHGFLKIYFPHGYCRFQPTCSEYAILTIEKYGVIKGGIKACWRILRCNPWNKGGIDPA
ncbi:MAG TPA: membrane protein insertion efficiency factor YidD [Candidatus Nanoarchaeia archaeon]|nr:membrane protein insertion efficiency factor YidD [Candidatus Nanoarchaeia archaeon]